MSAVRSFDFVSLLLWNRHQHRGSHCKMTSNYSDILIFASAHIFPSNFVNVTNTKESLELQYHKYDVTNCHMTTTCSISVVLQNVLLSYPWRSCRVRVQPAWLLSSYLTWPSRPWASLCGQAGTGSGWPSVPSDCTHVCVSGVCVCLVSESRHVPVQRPVRGRAAAAVL